MIYDYVIIGNNINSLMIAFYLFKENNKVLIIEKKNKNNFFLHINNEIVYKNPMYSNNDVNFLNFLNDINIDFKSIGSKINISFDLAKQFNLNELFIFFLEFINHFMSINESKQIKLSSKLNLFSDKSINYIMFLCDFYNYNFNEISYYDFIQIINNCVINEFFIINDNEIITQIFDYFSNNTNIKIKT